MCTNCIKKIFQNFKNIYTPLQGFIIAYIASGKNLYGDKLNRSTHEFSALMERDQPGKVNSQERMN